MLLLEYDILVIFTPLSMEIVDCAITSPHHQECNHWCLQKQDAATRSVAPLDPDFDFSATQNGHSLSPAGVDEAPAEMLMGRVCSIQISHQTMKRPVQFSSTMPMGEESSHLIMHMG